MYIYLLFARNLFLEHSKHTCVILGDFCYSVIKYYQCKIIQSRLKHHTYNFQRYMGINTSNKPPRSVHQIIFLFLTLLLATCIKKSFVVVQRKNCILLCAVKYIYLQNLVLVLDVLNKQGLHLIWQNAFRILGIIRPGSQNHEHGSRNSTH